MLTLRARILLILVIALSGLFVGACSMIGGGGDSESGDAETDVVESSVTSDGESSPAPTEIPVDSNVLSENPNQGVYLKATDDFSIESDYVEASKQADLIVIVSVGEPGEPFWTTVSGERPGVTVEGRMPDVPLEQLRWGSSPQIFTPWTLSIVQKLKGEAPEDGSILINWWGGEIFPDLFEHEGQPAFVEGEDLILYLKDCGADHLDKYGSPYRYIKRFILTASGGAAFVWETEGMPMRDVRFVIDRDINEEPDAEVSCS